VIAFIPLFAAQLIGGYSLIKDKSKVWTESAALAIFFGIGIGMTLITQIYNTDVNMTEFLKLWILCSIPLIYLFDSSVVSLAVWISIGWFISKTSWTDDYNRSLLSIGMMMGASIPYALKLISRIQIPGLAMAPLGSTYRIGDIFIFFRSIQL
jgi:uncharacterized membrane protein